jgi:hypothetical protein
MPIPRRGVHVVGGARGQGLTPHRVDDLVPGDHVVGPYREDSGRGFPVRFVAVSMWLNLVKAAPAFLTAVRNRPVLLDRLWLAQDPDEGFTADDLALLGTVDPTGDLLEERLGFGGAGDADDLVLAEFWTPPGTWLGSAVGIGADRLPYELSYGAAWYHAGPEVVRIAGGLSRELAGFGPAPGPEAREWAYLTIGRSVAAFYGRAADEGKAVIGGLA